MQISEHFTTGEFACQCGCGLGNDPADVAGELIDHLELMRTIRGDRPIGVKSGLRCPAHNEASGGVENSAHTRGTAADLRVVRGTRGLDRWSLVVAHVLATAVENGALTLAEAVRIYRELIEAARGLGVARGFVHVDTDEIKPRPAAWSY
jgi:hypothetical protein